MRSFCRKLGGCLAAICAVSALSVRAQVVFNELKINPPGTNDAPNEFIELAGAAEAQLTNIWLLALQGDTGNNPGKVSFALNLTAAALGPNGFLVVVATNHPFAIPPATTVITDPRLSQAGGAFPNGTMSILLVSSAAVFTEGDDLDAGDNGILERMPADAILLDAVSFWDGDKNDVVYAKAVLTLPTGAPDAASRFPGQTDSDSISAWFWGELAGTTGDALAYDEMRVSTNFPFGTLLTPGAPNRIAPTSSPIAPISGVIGDPSNPVVTISPRSSQPLTNPIVVWATSTNQTVVPDDHLTISAAPDGSRILRIDPIGVGYSEITIWMSDSALTGRVSFPYAASAPGRPGGAWHIGASDGSTAIPVTSELMIIGDDENQTLRLYPRYQSALPVTQFDMSPYLALPDTQAGFPREVDVEASTRSGNLLFWMGSHGHGADGEIRTNRTRVFCTELVEAGLQTQLSYVGRFDFLKVDLIDWDARNLHGKGTNYYGFSASDADGVPPKAPDGSGFSIEGLSMMPGSTNGAYVAFRAPIVPPTNRTYALIVPVLNFATVAASTGPPGSCVFGPPIELDLYGRGIRSLEGTTNGYLIIGGPAAAGTGPYPQDFRLYTWSGNANDQPQQREADLTGLNPEGIVELPSLPWGAATKVQLVSDCGSMVFYGDGTQAKHLTVPNFKKCRSDVLPIGAVTKPAPIITSIVSDGNSVTISWRALRNETYRLQVTTDWSTGNWADVPGEVLAPGPYASNTVVIDGPRRFYRVILPP